jgi:hypothetical protein
MLLLRGLKFLDPGFCSLLLVSVAARRRAKNDQGEQAKESEKQHHAEPRREGRLRFITTEWFWRGHG